MSEQSDPVSESAKAAQEIAKATGKAIEASREVGSFIAKYIGGTLEQAMGIFEDKLKHMRSQRQIRFMHKTDETLRELGLNKPNRSIAMKLAVPLLQGAAMEEDDSLQDRWVNLLVNASNMNSGVELHRSYIEILEHLTPLEATLLDVIYSLPFEQTRHGGVITENLPVSARVALESDTEDRPPPPNIQLALANLARLNCIRTSAVWGGGENFDHILSTILGAAFVSACKKPVKIS